MDRRDFVRLSSLSAAGMGIGSNTFLASCRTVSNLIMKETHKGEVPNIIVGSGYGGAVTALRLTEKGHKALIIEMGMRWDRTPAHDTFCPMIRADKRSSWLSKWPSSPITIPIPIKKYTGVLDKINYDQMDVFAGRAYGGGSIVNGGISIVPRRDHVEQTFPQIDSDEIYDRFFPLAKKELKVNSIPEDFYNKTKYYQYSRAAEHQAHKAGLKTTFFESTYDFDYMQREAKGEVYKSGLGGEVIYGNNAGKYSLDLTYLKKAEETGNLEIATLRKVRKITQTEDNKYALEVEVLDTKGAVTEVEIYSTPHIFLNAGSTGTNEILLKAKHEGDLSNISDELGKNWGPNGNIMTGRNFTKITGTSQSSIPIKGVDMWNGFPYKIFVELAPLPMGIQTWTNLFLAITDNPERGEFYYDSSSKSVKLNWRKEQNDYSVKAARYFLDIMKDYNGGTRSRLLFNNGFGDDFCYHPLGGCELGKVTDNYGRLKGYKGIYINDSSLIPGSAGVNPFVFITGLAERNMDTIIREDFA